MSLTVVTVKVTFYQCLGPDPRFCEFGNSSKTTTIELWTSKQTFTYKVKYILYTMLEPSVRLASRFQIGVVQILFSDRPICISEPSITNPTAQSRAVNLQPSKNRKIARIQEARLQLPPFFTHALTKCLGWTFRHRVSKKSFRFKIRNLRSTRPYL
jgi:hypothetical protein